MREVDRRQLRRGWYSLGLPPDPACAALPAAHVFKPSAVQFGTGACTRGLHVALELPDRHLGAVHLQTTQAIEHHTLSRLDEVEFITDRSIRQAVATQQPACLILSPLLTGGKVFEG